MRSWRRRGWRRRLGRGQGFGSAVGLALALAAPLPALSQGGAERPAEDAVAPPVAYDQLFKLPDATPDRTDTARKGGATRKEWESRFASARQDVASAKARLARTQQELEEIAAGVENWQMAPPGAAAGGGENSPLSYKLRQQIRRDRENVEAAERALTELRVEANLAGVPEEWQ